MSIYQTTRRSFLLAGSTALALPLLETYAPKAGAADANINTKPPTRMIFCGVGYGFTEDSFFLKTPGNLDKLTPGLSPLAKHKKDITVITNLTNTGASDPHGGSTSYLTGANVRGTPGKRFHNSVSCDLVAGQHLGSDMRYNSLVLASKEKDPGGHGQGMSLAWTKEGKPISGIRGPVELYGRLFGQAAESAQERQARLKKKGSILDVVLADAKSLNGKVSRIDKDKLDEYFQSIREIEIGLIKEEQWANKPKPKTNLGAPEPNIQGEAEARLTYQLMALALQTQQTSVVSYRQPVASIIRSMGMNYDPHALSHYGGSKARTEASQRRDQKSTELLDVLIDILKKTKELDGSSLFDNCIVSWGTNIRSAHKIKNVPTIITGRGGKDIKHGRHIVLPKQDTPLSNLWLTLMQQAGVPVKSFGGSTGIIPQLLVA